MKCLRCASESPPYAEFCSSCGFRFAPIKRKNGISTPVAILIAVVALCGLCGIIGGIGTLIDKKKGLDSAQTNLANGSSTTPTPTPTPTPVPSPQSFAELKSKGGELLKFERSEYKDSDLSQFDEVLGPLRQIPKESKDHKQAQELIKKLIDKSSVIGAEIVVLGPKPSQDELYVAFNRYLRPRLNDYSSSEYVSYTPARKVTVKGEPFWVSVLRLRAKNAFGAYMVKEVTMYIRNKDVVLADGL